MAQLNKILLPDYIVTGPFDMKQGMPYFISTKYNDEITWLGVMPEKVVFEFKILQIPEGDYRENYVVLPFNTEIKKAKDLCTELIDKGIMEPEDSIEKWNPETQKTELVSVCSFQNTDPIEPGVQYLITVTNEGTWTQK